MKIVLGIGNPGVDYAATRHNVGFMVVDALAQRWGVTGFRRRFDALTGEARVRGERVALLKPETFVNESGRALRRAADWYGAEPGDVLTVVDDFNLALGTLRVRRGGSSGGHRGLESVVQHMGVSAVPRLRFGIGSEQRRHDKDFVLSSFDVSEREAVQAGVACAADAVELWMREGIERCMNAYNVTPPAQDDREDNV